MPPTSVVVEPNGTLFSGQSVIPPQPAEYSLTAVMANAADTMPAWGTFGFIGARDAYLRAFWPKENWFASALFSTVGRYAAFGWSIKGGRNTAQRVQNLLHTAEHGKGWVPFITKVLIDLYTQDNGAFFEVVRAGLGEEFPAVELNHLDAGRCVRTGDRMNPVVYYDINGRGHRMPWWSVIDMAEFPSPDERWRGMQYSALTRCLKAAQIMFEMATYNHEKVSGRFTKAINLVSGVSTKMIEDAIVKHQAGADNENLTRYILPVVMGTLDPTARITTGTIELASLPENFDQEVYMRWYVAELALAFGGDYQDYAPLPGQALGTGGQAQVSHLKSRGKGPALFMRNFEHALNFHGVMPNTVTFQFGEIDTAAEYETTLLRKARAEVLKLWIESGLITTEVGRQIMVDYGDLELSYLAMMREENATASISVSDSNRVPAEPTGVKPGLPGPSEPPGTTPPAAPNSNSDQMPPSGTQRPAVPAG